MFVHANIRFGSLDAITWRNDFRPFYFVQSVHFNLFIRYPKRTLLNSLCALILSALSWKSLKIALQFIYELKKWCCMCKLIVRLSHDITVNTGPILEYRLIYLNCHLRLQDAMFQHLIGPSSYLIRQNGFLFLLFCWLPA